MTESGFYHDRDDLWESIPGVDFLTDAEYDRAEELFLNILDDVFQDHVRPQDSDYWDEFMDVFGFANDGDVWDWDFFRNMYNAA